MRGLCGAEFEGLGVVDLFGQPLVLVLLLQSLKSLRSL